MAKKTTTSRRKPARNSRKMSAEERTQKELEECLAERDRLTEQIVLVRRRIAELKILLGKPTKNKINYKIRDRVVRYLKKKPQGLSSAELVDALTKDPKYDTPASVRVLLSQTMHHCDDFKKIGSGHQAVWVLAE